MIRDDPRIEFVALGLGTDLDSRYPRTVPLRSMDDLGQTLVSVLYDCLGLGARRRKR